MQINSDSGIVTLPSRHSVDDTVRKLEELIHARGIRLFLIVDHSGDAHEAGLHMLPAKLLIFGNAKAGTPLMNASPGIALDLPLKILVSEDGGGKVWISYNSLAYLQSRHGVPPGLMSNLAAVEALARAAGE